MSLYCLGHICPRSKECLRAKSYQELIERNPEIDEMSLPDLAEIGIWFVTQADCKAHNYDSSVFPKKGGAK